MGRLAEDIFEPGLLTDELGIELGDDMGAIKEDIVALAADTEELADELWALAEDAVQLADDIEEPDELEDDYLDKAWGLEPESRLSCQAIVADEDLVVEIPKYTINMVSENH